jgi:phosphate transport system substrate-binding protein
LRFLPAIVCVLLIAAACRAAPVSTRDPLAGVYRIGGGDAAMPNVQALTDAFSGKHPGVKFEFDTSLGSDGGINLAADHTLDLGMASRELTAAESGLVERVLVGVAGTGLVVNASNQLKDLTTAQVLAIYTSKTTDWSAFGAAKVPIIPLVREKGSSARTTFETYIFGGRAAYGPNVLEIQGGDQIRQAVVGQPGAIGIIGVTNEDPGVPGLHLVTLDGFAPTKQALRDGTYKLRRPLYLVTAKNGERSRAIAELIDFIKSAEGQKIIDRF